jgi:uncharacterized membrane protein YdjX (TVP38/TMEM64 family)
MGKRLAPVGLGLAILSGTVTIFHVPVGDGLERVLAWVGQLGPWGPVLLVALYVAAGVLLLPGSILTVSAGFLYGVPLAFFTVWIGNTLGACAAFLVGRTLARDRMVRRVAGSRKFAAIDRAVAEHGFKVVLLTRLSPIFPYHLLNYAFGVTRVSLPRYALASWIGLVPGILLYVYVGAGLRPIAEVVANLEGPAKQPMLHRVFFWLGLLATALLAMLAASIAHKVLRRDLAEVSDGVLQNGD